MFMETNNKSPRLIRTIAVEIIYEWDKASKSGIYFGAKPYLEAMLALGGRNDMYGMDDAETIILYFLANAQTFRGPKAKELKQELKDLLKK